MKSNRNIVNLQGLNFLRGLDLKIAIFGGTFDPAHLGHLSISLQALNFYHFDYVIWLVANQNPDKPKNIRNIFDRAQTALDIAQHPKIIVSTAEYDLNCYFTYDSIKSITDRFPSSKFTWIMGIDNITHFKNWYRINDLRMLCNIIVFDRPLSYRMINIETLGLNDEPPLAKNKTKNIMIHRGKLCDLSSTFIRFSKEKHYGSNS